MKDIIIYEKKKLAVKLLIQAFLVTVASGLLIYLGIDGEDLLFCIIGGLGVLFFGTSTIVQLIRVIRRNPLFKIKDDGVYDSSSLTAVGFIPYEDMKEVVLGKTLGKESIGIYLKDIESFMNGLSAAKQKAIKSNLSNKFPPVVLRVDSVEEYTPLVVYEIIEKMLQKNND